MHKTLRNWRLKRSGNGMTVYGELDQSNALAKITDVVEVTPNSSGTISAIDRDGIRHVLLA